MKYIAITTIYKEYFNNKLFDNKSCKIGQNLLAPLISLKNCFLDDGYKLQTIDTLKFKDVEIIIFQDIPSNTFNELKKATDFIKYFLKNRKYDYFNKYIKKYPDKKSILLIMEPPNVSPCSYKKKYHEYFDIILTWDDDIIDNKKYFKINYPQPKPEKIYYKDFEDKKLCTLIASNKTSNYKNELYSKRLQVIEFCEKNKYDFDFYGMGWDKKYSNYKGYVDNKLDILSSYKFCICYENITGLKGYITEKIFDCFFANCVPIYWGADNILDYIPKETFIDASSFSDISEMFKYIENMTSETYNLYIKKINEYIESDLFNNQFSVKKYVDTIVKHSKSLSK